MMRLEDLPRICFYVDNEYGHPTKYWIVEKNDEEYLRWWIGSKDGVLKHDTVDKELLLEGFNNEEIRIVSEA